MFSLKVITILLILCALEKISAQESPTLESRWSKFIGVPDETLAQKNLEQESRWAESIGISHDSDEASDQINSKEELPIKVSIGISHDSDEISNQINPEEELPIKVSLGTTHDSDETSDQINSEEELPMKVSIGLSDKTLAQKYPEEESPLKESNGISEEKVADINYRTAKVSEILRDVAEMHGNKSENSPVSVVKWLKKPLIELIARCGRESTFAKEIKSYNHASSEISKLIFVKKNFQSNDVYPAVHNLWKNMFQVVFFEVDNCLDDGDVSLERKEKLHVISLIFREIADRTSYYITLEDAQCLAEKKEKFKACSLQPHELRDEPLFHVLLADFKPALGTCEENLTIKKCLIDVSKECSRNFQRFTKLFFSPPGGIPCENLEK